MNTRILTGITLVAALVLAACSQGTSTPAANSAASSAGTRAPSAAGQRTAPAKTGNACDRNLLVPADMAGILAEPITGTEPLKGDPQTCYFITATTDTAGGAEIRISVRPGLGEATIATFASNKMAEYVKSTPLAGVGDSAMWMPEMFEVNAQKNNLLCVAGLGGSAVVEHKPDDLPKKLGALCNKIFAAY